MKIVRSIAAVVVGFIVAQVVIVGIEFGSFVRYRPDDGKTIPEQMKEMQDNPMWMRAYLESLPPSAMVTVLAAYMAGAFLGGGVSALIAGRARFLHAGIIGAAVLALTILNALNMKRQYDFSHPDWMIIAGLLLPLPMSLLAGLIVAKLFPATAPPLPPVAPT